VVLAPEHPLVSQLTTPEYQKDIESYQNNATKKTQLERLELQKDKTGVFT